MTSPGIAPRFQPSRKPRPHPAFRSDRFNILCVADLNPRKRFDWLLQAVAQADIPGLHVVHAGPATVRRPPWAAQRDREHALEVRLGDHVTRLGRLDDGELLAAYQSADLLVLPSLDEGFGLPPLEALACGTPVAVTDIPIFRETLGSQATRFRDADDLVDVLGKAAARGPPTAAERGRRHAWVMRQHGWPQAVRPLLDLYARLDGKARGRRP